MYDVGDKVLTDYDSIVTITAKHLMGYDFMFYDVLDEEGDEYSICESSLKERVGYDDRLG